MTCPRCGEEMDYVGIVDGDDEVCDQYECSNCDYIADKDCIRVGYAEPYEDAETVSDISEL